MTTHDEGTQHMSNRNLAQFTEADAEKVLDRPVTEREYRALVKALPYSSIPDAFTEVVMSVAEDTVCDRHGGSWGNDETCGRCTFENGRPRPVDQPGPLGKGN